MKKNRLKVAVVALAASVSLVLTSCSSSSSDLFIASDQVEEQIQIMVIAALR